ncbi:citrate synthase [Phaffia rhodozyma]|uniref:Citrate synthase n=1 Tax=Phaffia rhodozyma TaxID=264483 RepID=A0A0F7SS04_PHARH|nr:citrate synthase [Phaffia rhodozyma]
MSRKILVKKMEEAIPIKREKVAALKKNHGSLELETIKLDHILNGGRGLTTLLWEGSSLDPNEGIRFRSRTLPEILKTLPNPRAESMFWYLLTGEVPTKDEAVGFSKDLAKISGLGREVENVMDSLPRATHPMTQLQIGVALLANQSAFSPLYASETPLAKSEYWRSTLDDSLALVAKLPSLAARIYRNTYFPNRELAHSGKQAGDLIHSYASTMKYMISSDKDAPCRSVTFEEYLGLYIALHSDHEGGNVSAHATQLVGSALVNPFTAYSAGVAGLSGPLHGLANQNVLKFILQMQAKLSANPTEQDESDEQAPPKQITDEDVKTYLWDYLKSGRVIPGYGHAVLRSTDPRFTALQDFTQRHAKEFENSEVVRLVKVLAEITPGVLKEHGKTKNPNPNVDATSGCLLHHYGLTQIDYYTVIFGISRAIGTSAQLVWDRALGLPIERPKSITLDGLERLARAKLEGGADGQ